MLILKLWNYFRGYVIITIEGYFLEKFINICIHREIFLWDIKRHGSRKMTLKISINGFKMLRPIALKTKCRVRIAKRVGLPFVKNRYKKRKTFLIGAVACIVLFYIMTSFIWSIEISGNKKINSDFIMEKLSESGVKQGTLKYKVDTKKVVSDLMLKIDKLGWVGVSVKGTKLKVQIDERIMPPVLIEKDKPCDIVAKKDGIIKSVISKTGFDLVKPGDTVVEGQILVTGNVPGKEENSEVTPLHAISTVKARTWYEGISPVVIKPTVKERTGNKTNKYTLVLFGKRISLPWGKVSYSKYDKIEIKKALSLGEDLVFPFEFIDDIYYETHEVEKEISSKEAEDIATHKAYDMASETIPEDAEIIKKDTKILSNDDGTKSVKVIIECIENIGVSKEIGGDN
ncbi:sporulation protein YqfD [Pseudobacteroides cellulosolvens]|uniref:Sporulation protein YqfD n=1 Tax=Pseudobacteroides cellulosolvens ATCC 35603 = DSM 2933 TaxID=398512 RepID=A0A0L6JJ28_9FIRM|nr:sporulation protein YqfD [Pseudobacteroides cellulosolvens]KNY25744.1 sporulation protein YqfD [Pseudobacteroides cellulosolvens ATCC 35603 = DSM 2933]